MLARLTIFPIIASCLLLLSQEIHAQVSSEFRIAYQDSMTLKAGFRLLSNNIAISNPNAEEIALGIYVRPSRRWREIVPFKKEDYMSVHLNKDESINLPLNLLVTNKADANWDSVTIKVWNHKTGDTFFYYPKIKMEPTFSYRLEAVNPAQSFVDGKPDSVTFIYKVTNTGNATDIFTFYTLNKRFDLDYKVKLQLGPRQDTTLQFSIKMSQAEWEDLFSEKIVLQGKSEQQPNVTFSIFIFNKPASTVYQNKLSHLYFPLTIGGGMMVSGNEVRYFGQVRTTIKFGNHVFSADYRTKDFGPLAYTFQQHQINASYSYKGLQVSYGQITGAKNFYSIAKGVAVRYDDYRRGWGVYASGLKHIQLNTSNSYQNDVVFAGTYYRIKKAVIRHALESNFDRAWGINSYLLFNEAKVLDTKNLLLSLTAGVGYQVAALENQIPDFRKSDLGYSGGYNFHWGSRSGWSISSTLQYANTRFPGITKGTFNHMHIAGRNLGKVFIGLNYFSNTTTQNALRDTMFNSDYLVVNVAKYGLNATYNAFNSNSTIGIGRITQTGGIASRNNNWYFDFSHLQSLGSYQNVNLTARSAMTYVGVNDIFWTVNATLRLNTRHIGIIGIYNRIPSFQSDNPGVVRARETVNGGPSVNFHLFHSTISGSCRYNISKTISESVIRHGIGGQINYNSLKSGLNISASGFLPLQDPGNLNIPVGEVHYASVTLSKQLNIPYKKLNVSDVTIRLFKDLNNSGRYDSGDSLFTNLPVNFGEKILITDENGQIHYRNVRPGTYSLNLLNINSGNYVANGGGMHKVVVQNEDVVMEIPFKKGKKISGSIKIDRDTLGTFNLTPDNFKILVTDTSGHTILTITDQDGNFESFVSEGIYTVALPADYFPGTDFKPVQISYIADLTQKEEVEINFTIKQKKRLVRFLDSDKK